MIYILYKQIFFYGSVSDPFNFDTDPNTRIRFVNNGSGSDSESDRKSRKFLDIYFSFLTSLNFKSFYPKREFLSFYFGQKSVYLPRFLQGPSSSTAAPALNLSSSLISRLRNLPSISLYSLAGQFLTLALYLHIWGRYHKGEL